MNTALAGSHSPSVPRPRSKGLRVGLWIAQALLAFAFGAAGAMKLTTPYAELTAADAWAREVPETLVRFIGTVEVAGAIGILLPALTRVKPFLTPLAAAGFVVVMILAGGLHMSIGELPIANVILGALAAFVAWGRWRAAPISPRGAGTSVK